MKNWIKLPAVLLGLLLLFTGTTQQAMAQNEDVSLQSFYDELSPYGTWIQDPQYGYVWRPDVDQAEFRPYYTNGRWAMTEYGNTWVSNYDWGWAPFHYGRWIHNRYNNWIWLPDTVWGPAWVTWRSGGGTYGWAPMGPNIGININVGRSYRIPDYCWNFVPQRNIYYDNFPRYYSRRNNVYIQNTVIINNTYVRNSQTYYGGPRAEDIRRATNQNVTVYDINRRSRSGASRIENNTVNIYSPRPSRGSSNTNAAPRDAVNADVRTEIVSRNNSVTRPSRAGDANAVNGRNNNGITDRPERGERNNAGANNSHNGNILNRPSRGGDANAPIDRNNNGVIGRLESGERNSSAGSNSRTSAGILNRPSRGSDEVATPTNRGTDRPAQSESSSQRPQRDFEGQRVSSQPQRVERPQANQQVPERAESRMPQRQQQAPERVERPQPQQQPQTQRPERSRAAEGERSSGAERESNGGGGRPGRG